MKKLENRSKKFILVGYSPKEYRLWDAKNRKIILSRDVKFEEDIVIETKKDRKNILSKIEDIEEESEEQMEEEPEARGTEDESSSEEYEDVEDNENCNVQEKEIEQRKSTRAKKFPEKYGDYVFLTFQEAITSPEKEE